MPENGQNEKIDTLSEWVKAVRSVIQIRIGKLRRSMRTKATFVFKDHEFSETLSTIQYRHVVVPADKAPNNIILISKEHYNDCLKIELGLENSQSNPTTLSKEEIIDNHMSVLSSFSLSMKDEDCVLPLLYWIPKLHMCP
jgi:hypothetical protein